MIDFRMPRSVTRTRGAGAPGTAEPTVKTEDPGAGAAAAAPSGDGETRPHQGPSGDQATPSKAPRPVKPSHTFESIPEQGQTFYQLCDLQDAEMQLVVNTSPIPSECDPKLGWYTKEALLQLRRLMKRKLQGFLVEAGISTNIDGYLKSTGKLDTEWMKPSGSAAESEESAPEPTGAAAAPASPSAEVGGQGEEEEEEEDEDEDEDDDEEEEDDDDDDEGAGPEPGDGAAAAPANTAADSLNAVEEFVIFGDEDSDGE